jgi:hypothetical protein
MKKLIRRIRYWLKKPVAWDKAVHASCWDGNNAQKRMMNILSPFFPDGQFREYMDWMKERGCDTAHVILINLGDGGGSGYNCALDEWHADTARRRIRKLFLEGFAIVPWIITDDSAAWLKDLFAHPEERIGALAEAGLFDHASYVVLGLEMDEAGSAGNAGWPKVAEALRKHFKGKIGTHHTSGNTFKFAGLGDIVLGQLDPGRATPSAIANQIRAIRALGKEAVGFEYARSPDRTKAQAALDAGAFGCGNW